MKKILKILSYIILAFVILFAIGIVILSTFSGNSESWKMQVEDMASSLTAKNVTIGTLHEARMFPDLLFDGEAIYAEAITEPASEGEVPIPQKIGNSFLIRKLQFSIPFWSIFWGHPVVKHLLVEDVRVIGVDNFTIDSINIEMPEGEAPKLSVQGHYQEAPFSLKAELEKRGGGYATKPNTAFTSKMNHNDISGVIVVRAGNIRFEDMVFTSNDQSVEGYLELTNDKGFELLLEKNDTRFLRVQPVEEDTEPKDSRNIAEISDELAENILTSFCQISQQEYLQVTYLEQDLQIYSCEEASAEKVVEEAESEAMSDADANKEPEGKGVE